MRDEGRTSAVGKVVKLPTATGPSGALRDERRTVVLGAEVDLNVCCQTARWRAAGFRSMESTPAEVDTDCP